MNIKSISVVAATLSGLATMVAPASAQNLVVDGSLCVGNDCPASPSFGFATIRLQENNLRIHFDDTSSTSSFPDRDWRIVVNASSNGGPEYFAVEDSTAARQVFRIFGGARANALVVDSQGDLGLGTETPATDIHVKIGDTPTLRLEQDGSSGFTPQTWDVAGNEAGFFIRDATGGSTLPFRIRPGASSQSLVIDGDDEIGIGTLSPQQDIHIDRSSGNAAIRLETAAGSWELVSRPSDGEFAFNDVNTVGADFVFETRDTDDNSPWQFIHRADEGFAINSDTTPAGADFYIQSGTGNVQVLGTLTSGGPTCGGGCDAVFEPDYVLPSIDEHAVQMFESRHLPAVGPTSPEKPLNLTEHVGNMLNELEKAHIYIAELNQRNRLLEAQLAARDAELAERDRIFEERLLKLESRDAAN